jgi:hypothetical protein
VNGLRNSYFGTHAYCNAVNFFSATNAAIAQGLLHVPSLGVGTDGYPCVSTQDFFLVDATQSSGVVTTYLTTTTSQVKASLWYPIFVQDCPKYHLQSD